MADHFTNETVRVKLKYSTFDGVHTTQFRFAAGALLSAGMGAVADFVEQIQPYFYNDTTFESIQGAQDGSDEFLVELPIGLTGTSAGERSTQQPGGYYWNFTAKSTGGAQTGWYLYGTPYITNKKSRLAVAANTAMNGIREAMVGYLGGAVAIDNEVIYYRTYVNIGINDYLMHQHRQ